MTPRVSVVIATYYRNDLLRDAIESALAQEYESMEIVVVDDSGEGHAAPVLEEYDEVRGVLREENGNWEAAYTTGIEAATGEYIQLLDDDDLLLNGKVAKTAAVLRDNPDVGVVYCGVETPGERRYPTPEQCENILERTLRFDNFPVCTISMLIERDLLLDVLPLSGPGGNNGPGDINLILDLAQRTEFDYVDECLVRYRTDESRQWVGVRRFEMMRQMVRHRNDLYGQYPSIRRSALAEIYEGEGRNRLDSRGWSPRATLCFLKATYYSEQRRLQCGAQFLASLFGRRGLTALRGLRDTVGTG